MVWSMQYTAQCTECYSLEWVMNNTVYGVGKSRVSYIGQGTVGAIQRPILCCVDRFEECSIQHSHNWHTFASIIIFRELYIA